MRFTDVFGITTTELDDWFDPVLSTDTQLFVDPLRIYADRDGFWGTAHGRLVEFFNTVLTLVARAAPRDSRSAQWRAAQRLLLFPLV